MANLVIVTGSTIADATSQSQALIGAGDYVDNLDLTISSDKDLVGTQYTVSFVKNNGPFAGFKGADRVTFSSSTGSLTQVAAGLAIGNTNNVLGLVVRATGSPTTGSIIYYGIKAVRTFDAA